MKACSLETMTTKKTMMALDWDQVISQVFDFFKFSRNCILISRFFFFGIGSESDEDFSFDDLEDLADEDEDASEDEEEAGGDETSNSSSEAGGDVVDQAAAEEGQDEDEDDQWEDIEMSEDS